MSQTPFMVTVLDDYQAVAGGSADWAALGPDVEVRFCHEHESDEDRLVERLADSHAVVAMRERTPLSAELLGRLPNLALVVTTGMRNASITPTPGVTFCGTRALVSPPVELTWALILAARRHVVEEGVALRVGDWQTTVGEGLENATLGLLGLGRIGERVAAVARAFGMRVIAWSENLTDDRARDAGASRVSRERLFKEADTVSIHLRLSGRTRGLVGADDLARLGPRSLLVNTSRAEIVDQDALIDALESGALGGAALDVYNQEPLPADHPLLAAPRTTLTPHLGYVVRQNYEIFFTDVVEDIRAFREGRPIRVVEAD